MTIINDAQGGENLDLNVKTLPAVIEWNKEAVMSWAKAYAEKYKGFAMTDDNVSEIKEVCADLQSKVKRLEEIRLEQGRKFKAPLDKYYSEIKEVQKLMSDIREPLWADVQKFEESERQKRIATLKNEIAARCTAAGLRDKFSALITPQDSWSNKSSFNKTYITKNVLNEIDTKISSLLHMQADEDQAEEMKRQRREMAVTMCKLQSDAVGLAKPIEPKDIYGLDNLTLSDLPAAITTAVTRRKESEQAAIDREEKRKADDKKRAEQQKIDAEASRIRQANIDAANLAIARVEQQKEAVRAAEELPFAPAAPPVEKQFKIDVSVFGTEAELTTFLSIIESNGYNCVMGEMKEVEGAA